MEVMLDIETMSTSTSRALVLSVGAQKFMMRREMPDFGEQLLVVFETDEQLLRGREVLVGTQRWWAQQSPEARRHWFGAKDKHSLASGLEALSRFVDAGSKVWANGVVFDIGNLESLYSDAGYKVPWEYNAVRDARTVYQLFPVGQRQRPPAPMAAGMPVAHDPVDDCREQIWRLWERLPEVCFGLEGPE